MAIPAILPLAAQAAASGKAAAPTDCDQGFADFAAVLALRGAATASSDSESLPAAEFAATPANFLFAAKAMVLDKPDKLAERGQGLAAALVQQISANASSDGGAPASMPAQRVAARPAEAAGKPLPTAVPGAPAADETTVGAIAIPAPELPENSSIDDKPAVKAISANAGKTEKTDKQETARGIANALEQLEGNPGLGLGLTGRSPQTAETPVEKSGKPAEKNRPASLPDANAVASILATPLALPPPPAAPNGNPLDTGALPSASLQMPPPAPESRGPAADLAGEAGPGAAIAPPGGGFAAALAAQQAAPPASPSASLPPVDKPLHAPGWAGSFGEGIVWMAKNELQSAQININPPQLGPVQITLHLNGDQASAIFASPHAEVRQAIQDALPQLRDMLATSGINLGQADVGSQGSAPRHEFAMQHGNQNRYGDETAILSPDMQFADNVPALPVQRGRGLVDLFA